VSAALAIPTQRELEAVSPADRWAMEEKLGEAQEFLREFNDEELRRWVEDEYKTQTEIAKLVGRSTSQISRRCIRLGITASSNRGRPRISPGGNSPVLDAEVVEDTPPVRPTARRRNGGPEGPAHHLPDVMAEDALENLRTQALHWFEQGLVVKELLDKRRPLEPRSAEDRQAIKREAAVMERVARRLKEACE
jgi:hypothetical protein